MKSDQEIDAYLRGLKHGEKEDQSPAEAVEEFVEWVKNGK
jgi:hypothetical protein